MKCEKCGKKSSLLYHDGRGSPRLCYSCSLLAEEHEIVPVPIEMLRRWWEVISNVDAVSGDDELLFLGREIDALLKEGK